MACVFALSSTGGSYAMPSAPQPVAAPGSFAPVMIQGINVHPENAMLLDFIVDPGQEKLGREALTSESSRLVKYFMAALAVPQDDLWVNLSPYEKDRVVPEALGQTDLGRDMLAQDYLLKQVTASLMNPQGETGRKFWARVYARAQEKFGTIDIPVDTFNKVWIMPAKAVVYQNKGKAVVVEARLKVMLDADYLAAQNAAPGEVPDTLGLAQEVIREIVLPVLEDEVNIGKDFAPLRQIYHALILAHWFRNNLKASILNKVYADKKRIRGIDLDDKQVAQKIWARYVASFQKGVYNFIQEERDPVSGESVPRKYFSGGEKFDNASLAAVLTVTTDAAEGRKFVTEEPAVLISVALMAARSGDAPDHGRTVSGDRRASSYDPDMLRQLDRNSAEARTAALQKLLSDQGLTREKAAPLLGVSYTAYRNMEVKGRVNPRTMDVEKLMDVLGIPPDDRDLFKGIFVPQAPPELSFDELFREYGQGDRQTFCGRKGFIAFMKQRLGCTNEALAAKLGVGIIAIENWIKHEDRLPTWDVLMRIAEKGGLSDRVDIYRLVRMARGDPSLTLNGVMQEAEDEIYNTPADAFDKVNFFSRLYLKMLAYSGLTENHIADLTGLHRQYLAMWHSAVNKISPEDVRYVSPENAVKLADAFIIDDPALSRRLSYLFLGVARSGTIEEVLEQVKGGAISAGRMLRLIREQKGLTIEQFWEELVKNYSEKYGFYVLTPQGGFRTLQKAETGAGYIRDEKLAYAIADHIGLQTPAERDVFVNRLTEPRRFGYPPALYPAKLKYYKARVVTDDKPMRRKIRASIPSADLWLRKLDRDVRQGNRSFIVTVEQRVGAREDRLVAMAYFHQEKYPVTEGGKVSFEIKSATPKDVLVLELLEAFPEDINRASVVREILYRGFGWAQENGVEKIVVIDPDGLKNMRAGSHTVREYLKFMGLTPTSTTYLSRLDETAAKVFESMFCNFQDMDRGIPPRRFVMPLENADDEDGPSEENADGDHAETRSVASLIYPLVSDRVNVVDIPAVKNSLISPEQAAYFMAFAQKTNPRHEKMTVVNGASGPSIIDTLLAFDATDVTNVLDLEVSIDELGEVLDEARGNELWEMRAPGGVYTALRHKRDQYFWDINSIVNWFPQLVMQELVRSGVDKNSIVITGKKGEVVIRFLWAYPGEIARTRTVRFITADLTDPDGYPQALTGILSEPGALDYYFQKSAMDVLSDRRYLAVLGRAVRKGMLISPVVPYADEDGLINIKKEMYFRTGVVFNGDQDVNVAYEMFFAGHDKYDWYLELLEKESPLAQRVLFDGDHAETGDALLAQHNADKDTANVVGAESEYDDPYAPDILRNSNENTRSLPELGALAMKYVLARVKGDVRVMELGPGTGLAAGQMWEIGKVAASGGRAGKVRVDVATQKKLPPHFLLRKNFNEIVRMIHGFINKNGKDSLPGLRQFMEFVLKNNSTDTFDTLSNDQIMRHFEFLPRYGARMPVALALSLQAQGEEYKIYDVLQGEPYIDKQLLGDLLDHDVQDKYQFILDNFGAFFYLMAQKKDEAVLKKIMSMLGNEGIFYAAITPSGYRLQADVFGAAPWASEFAAVFLRPNGMVVMRKAGALYRDLQSRLGTPSDDIFDLRAVGMPQILEDVLRTDVTLDQAAVVDGGIDLKAGSMAVEVTGDNAEFRLPEDRQGVDLDKLQGLRPVIISVMPLGDIPAYLGLD